MIYTPEGGGEPTVMNIYDFKGKGVAMSMYNTDEVCPDCQLLGEG
jgi:isocitrate dehydrogenase